MSEGGKNRREAAAAARAASQSGVKRRERTIRVVGAVTVVVVVAGIIGIAVVAKSTDTTGTLVTATADPTAALPAGVFPAGDINEYGVPYNPATTGVPVLTVWEDFQCPSCGILEETNGAGIVQLADEGKIQLIWRPTTFLDARLANDDSTRAVAAWGCAVDAGKTLEYHKAVFQNRPVEEGDGYSDEQLLTFATDAGIAGPELDTFTQCVAARTYVGWAANSYDTFQKSQVPGTPAGFLNGNPLGDGVLGDPVALAAAVAAEAAK
ncbi:MAG: thioredoxin domain-containing protein [Actinomycetota bacterium]|nr:thioredoxin domain-containing protein [Actinomycetota bacterium]